MPGRHAVTFSMAAIRDLEAIREWYADQHVPEVGERLLADILASVERLADFPQSGRIVPEFNIVNLREIIHPPFRIVYRLGPRRARIVRVRRSERLLKRP